MLCFDRELPFELCLHVPLKPLDKVLSLPLGNPCAAHVEQLDVAEGTSPFSVRYYHRDKMRKHTAYYPDTPLSLNHNSKSAISNTLGREHFFRKTYP